MREILWEGFRESRRCSRDAYSESYISEQILIYEENAGYGAVTYRRFENASSSALLDLNPEPKTLNSKPHCLNPTLSTHALNPELQTC